MSKVRISRKTKETSIEISLTLAGTKKCSVNTGIGFLDHMLELFAFHGNFDLDVKCTGDLQVDSHHTAEDTGIALGQAFKKAWGDAPQIKRFAHKYVTMDETLTRCVVDVSGRPFLVFRSDIPKVQLGNFETETVKEFFQGFVNNAAINLHIETLYGENTHHIIESIFKSFALTISEASRKADIKGVPSTKGVL